MQFVMFSRSILTAAFFGMAAVCAAAPVRSWMDFSSGEDWTPRTGDLSDDFAADEDWTPAIGVEFIDDAFNWLEDMLKMLFGSAFTVADDIGSALTGAVTWFAVVIQPFSGLINGLCSFFTSEQFTGFIEWLGNLISSGIAGIGGLLGI